MTNTKSVNVKSIAMIAAVAVALFAVVLMTQQVLAVERVDGFVCPVITTENVLHVKNGAAIGDGHYSVIGPDVMIPVHATNGNGAGTPPGPHSAPGDTDYTAIWAK